VLFRADTLEGIRAGRVTLAVRRWRRPTVRTGGTLVTAVGVLAIDSVERIEATELTERDAHAAGAGSLAELLDAGQLRREGDLYRIRFHLAGDDPRIALREQAEVSEEQMAEVLGRLARLDRSSRHGGWTVETLQLIAEHPGVRAGDLAAQVGREMQPFKTDVRKLKALGLTESLEVGYRLSPRGTMVLERLTR
jgi:hypothetical protein